MREATIARQTQDMDIQGISVQLKNVDEPIEIAHYGIQIIAAAAITLFGVPFSTTLTLNYYEAQHDLPIGSWWYVGCIFLILPILIVFFFLTSRGEHFWFALVRTLLSSAIIFIFSIFINSLWQHGQFFYTGYFESYRIFFTSDVIISTALGITATGLFTFIPLNSVHKHENISDFEEMYCDENGICTVPTINGDLKLAITKSQENL